MKPKYALVGINPSNLEACYFAGWCSKSLDVAAKDKLITIRTTWKKMQELKPYFSITEKELMELSE